MTLALILLEPLTSAYGLLNWTAISAFPTENVEDRLSVHMDTDRWRITYVGEKV